MKELFGKASKLLCLILVLAMMLSVFAGCKKDDTDPDDTGDADNSGNRTYTVSLKTQGGMAMEGVDVYIYTDDTLSDLVAFDKTDDKGIVNFSLPKKDDYAIALSGVTKGYDTKSSYAFNNGTAVITLASSLVTGSDITTAQLGLGDIMYDCTLTGIDGEKIVLSDILAEKKVVLLNFWYTTCSACQSEFPVMAEIYEQYKDEVEIIAIDPLDDATSVATFAESYGLPFPVASAPYVWTSIFDVSAYPTTVVIDRYGMISLVEVGATTSKGAWINLFDYYTADDYQQKLVNEFSELVVPTKPTYEMPAEEDVAAVLGATSGITAHYYAADSEYAWPFLVGEHSGTACMYASNQNIDSSYAIICIDVELKAGQALGLDYWSSSETGADIMHIIVDDEDVYRISGISESWTSVYPCVAEKDGTYKIVISYIKDSDTDEGDDTVYIKNLRILNAADIDTATYLSREAATTTDGFTYSYVDIYYNETDGYYHVNSKNGPLLLANLTAGTSQFSEVDSAYMLIYENGNLMVDGVDCYEKFQNYASYASNATILGYCPVTEELLTYLKAVARDEGFDSEDENEWMRMCIYYAAYGTNGAQLENPIQGLCNQSAYVAKLGKGISTNYFYYDRAIYPRGLWAGFTPTKSGVYRITSVSDSVQGVDGWIAENVGSETLTEYEADERAYDGDEVSMVYYMEAGKTYYFSIAFWDMYEEGYIYYDIEYIAPTYELFRLASPAYFTYDSEDLLYTIAGGIDVVLKDGVWYEDLGLDAKGNQKYGGKLYVDFTGSNGLFSNPIMSYDDVTGMIDMGGFDFSRTENDEYVLSVLRANGNDVEKTIAYLKDSWGEDYDEYAANYQLEDVLAGIYHGDGKDYTETMRKYISKVDRSNTERNGCVVATKELTDILQLLMDKYTFEGVDHSWTKLCYYYDYLGPEK